MDRSPLVTVIVPFLNAERYLEEAIESVLAQTYPDWELVLVDDGSSDRSGLIARGYAERRPDRIRYLQHERGENRGAAASRNLGVRAARGELLAFLDADDVWLPDKLERQVGIFEELPQTGMVCGASLYWFSWTGEPGAEDVTVPVGAASDLLHFPPALLLLLYPLGEGGAPCVSGWILKREVVRRVGGFEERFHGRYQLYEDQAFLAKIYLEAPVFVSSSCWDRYRQRPDSCVPSVRKAGEYHLVRSFFLDWLEDRLRDRGVRDREVWRLLRHAQRRYRHPLRHRIRTKTLPMVRGRLDRVARRSLPAPLYRGLKNLVRRILPRRRPADASVFLAGR